MIVIQGLLLARQKLLWAGALTLLLSACGNMPEDDSPYVRGKADNHKATQSAGRSGETFVDSKLDVVVYPDPRGLTQVYRRGQGLDLPQADDAGRHPIEVQAGDFIKIIFVSGDGLRDDWVCTKTARSLPFERTVEEWVKGSRYIFSFETREDLAGKDIPLRFASDNGDDTQALQEYELILKFVKKAALAD